MATTTVGRTTIQGATTVGGFNPATLFSAGEQGVWYDPSDLSTLFQDSAGTIPVTALEQPVGRMLDKSGRGNHATQATSANRPVVSARVNILTYSEQFDNAAWSKEYVTVTADATVAPNGALTADKLVETAANNVHDVYRLSFAPATYSLSVYAKAAERSWIKLENYDGATDRITYFDVSNGVLGTVASGHTATITSAGNGWYLCTITFTTAAVAANNYIYIGIANGNNGNSYTGDTSKGVFIWGADLRPTNQGVGLPVYQRVGAAVAGTSTTVGNADYDANGFPVYLSFDGSNDSLATGNINLSGTDTITTFAGARKLSDAALGMLWEISADAGSNAGTAYQTFPVNVGGSTRILARGSISNGVDYGPYAAPVTQLTSTVQKTAAANSTAAISFRANSVTASGSVVSSNASTGNYGTWPIYIGARGGSSFFFNGNLYGLIVRGASSTANQITGAENWLNQKTAAY